MNDAERESLVTIFEPRNQEISPDLQQAEKERESPEVTCVEEVNIVEEDGENGEKEVQIECEKCPQLFLTEADVILHTDFQHGEINDTLNNLQDFNVLLEEEEAEKENPDKVKVTKSKKSIEEICKELETSQRPLIKFKWPKIKVKAKSDSDDDEMDILLQSKGATKPTQVKVPILAKGNHDGRKPPNGNSGRQVDENQRLDKAEGEANEEVIVCSKKSLSGLTKKEAPKCFKRKDWNQEGKWKSGFLHVCDSTFYQSWPEAKVWLEQNQDHLMSGQESQILAGEKKATKDEAAKKEKGNSGTKTPLKREPKTPKKSESNTPTKSVTKKTPTKLASKTPTKSALKSTTESHLQTPKKSHTIKSESKTPNKAKTKTPIKSELKTPRKSKPAALKTPTKSNSKTLGKNISKTASKSNTKKASIANLGLPSKSQKKPKVGKVSKEKPHKLCKKKSKVLIKFQKPKSVIKDYNKSPLSSDNNVDEFDGDKIKKRKLELCSESQAKRRKISEVVAELKGDAEEGSLQVKWDCNQCGASFAVKRNLAVHMQKKHGVYDHFDQVKESQVLKTPSKRKSWDCDPCDFQFELKRDLATHNETEHRAKRAPGLRQCK